MAEAEPGRVYLVGAGPGDPGLLTARALELIASAEVILHDRLIPASALEGAREDAELVYVGKVGGGASVAQEDTERMMVSRARAGRSVVRLKGGDPFVFGRGGEEARALRAAGISFEVVPGVSAGVAAPAYAGIPVTHRGVSSAVAFVTGHEDPGKPSDGIDWQMLAAFPGTLVLYMGVRALGDIARALIAGGRSESEPAAIVEAGTLPAQRTVTATLGSLAEVASAEQIRAPAITVVGPVAAMAAELSWLPPRPLLGRTVAVTRARAQASCLVARLERLGAQVVALPAIRTRRLAGPPLDPSGYDLICLTSPNGVEGLFERLAASGRDARALAGARVGAIGPGTAAALAAHGVSADIVPERSVAEGLAEALEGVGVGRALIAQAREGRDVLAQALRARGVEVEVLAVYETLAEEIAEDALASARGADYITFTSASTVRFLREASPELPTAGTRIVSIGPLTSQALREHGLQPHIEAARHDIDGVTEALLADVAGGGNRGG